MAGHVLGRAELTGLRSCRESAPWQYSTWLQNEKAFAVHRLRPVDGPHVVTIRKQLSMVLPVSLISAIKQRASLRGQSITAYITRLVQQDLAFGDEGNGGSGATTLVERLEALEQRVSRLEHQVL